MPTTIYPSGSSDIRFDYPDPWETKGFFKNQEPTYKNNRTPEHYPQHMSFWRILDFKKFTDPPKHEEVLPPAPGDPPLERDPPHDKCLYYLPKCTCKYWVEYTDRRDDKAEMGPPPRGVSFVKLTLGDPHSPLPKSLAALRLERALVYAARKAAKAARAAKRKRRRG